VAVAARLAQKALVALAAVVMVRFITLQFLLLERQTVVVAAVADNQLVELQLIQQELLAAPASSSFLTTTPAHPNLQALLLA
jgi:hypothetical protein